MRLLIAAVLGTLCGNAAADVSVTLTSTESGGQYAPKNIVAVWIEDANGTFVKTIGRWANLRKTDLSTWIGKAGGADTDAISGATRTSHQLPLNAKWNLRNRTQQVMPDGNYVVKMESTDTGANHVGSFPFVKGPTPQKQRGLTSGGFLTVTVDFGLLSNTCGNGIVEAGETCDGNCSVTCPDLGIKCFASAVIGADCNVECMTAQIFDCVDGDGCCPEGCDGMDAECPGGNGGSGSGGGGTQDLSSCDTGSGASWWPFALGFAVLLLRRRR